MLHEVDRSGYPVDMELRLLEERLSDLAAEWRDAYGDMEAQTAIVHLYRATMNDLIQQFSLWFFIDQHWETG